MESKETHKTFKIEPLLGGVALLLLLIGCFFVLKPFMTALMWAIILAYSLHPLQRSFTRWFRGSRTLAACFVTLTLTVILAGPIVLIGFSIAQDGKDLADATKKWLMAAPEKAPKWVAEAPIVGDQLASYWSSFAEDRNRWMDQLEKEVKTTPPRPKIVIESDDGLIVKDAPPPPADAATEKSGEEKKAASAHVVVVLGQFLVWARTWLIAVGLAVWAGVTQVVLSAFLAFFLLRDAPVLSERLAVAVERLAGERGQHLIKVAGGTVRGVIYGILGTAIAQALVAGLGFWIAGLPGAVLLSVLTFFFAVIPFGPPLIWIPASLWLFAQDKPGMGIFMVLWGLLGISSVDNFLRPYLISQGSKMPFVLIFCGVIGGALAFGLVGVFMGPTMLAVAFRLVEEWSAHRAREESGLILETSSGLRGGIASDTQPHGGKSIGVR
ncbi:MAG: AI-2E family transporter [Luteolibacter sp.]|uniref:AI-2E family transporter n=1 Tax=Luteolibacter sp. TaxID=1962973 RepID=UPI0032630973